MMALGQGGPAFEGLVEQRAQARERVSLADPGYRIPEPQAAQAEVSDRSENGWGRCGAASRRGGADSSRSGALPRGTLGAPGSEQQSDWLPGLLGLQPGSCQDSPGER